jgi:hypothetical protein
VGDAPCRQSGKRTDYYTRDFLPDYFDRRIVAASEAIRAKSARLKQLQPETAADLDTLLPATLERTSQGEL